MQPNKELHKQLLHEFQLAQTQKYVLYTLSYGMSYAASNVFVIKATFRENVPHDVLLKVCSYVKAKYKNTISAELDTRLPNTQLIVKMQDDPTNFKLNNLSYE